LSILAGLVKARRQTVVEEQSDTDTASCCGSKNAEEKTTSDTAEKDSCCGGSSKAETTAIDPICGMTVEIEGAEYHSEYEGKDYYFCCGGCLHNFEHEPEKYLNA